MSKYPTPLALTVAVALCTALLSGCASFPRAETEFRLAKPLSPPAQWSENRHLNPAQNGWKGVYSAPQLQPLLNEALRHNYSLVAAEQRLLAAYSAANGEVGTRLPSINLNGSGARTKSQALVSGAPRSAYNNSFGLNLGVQWEVDLWGKLSSRHKAAVLGANASAADYHATKLTLQASVARAWFAAIAAQEQLALARDTQQSFNETATVIEDGLRGGLGNALDLHLARANASAATRRAHAAATDLDTSVRQLEILLGRYPSGRLKIARNLPAVGSTPASGQPAQLLERRPDILAAGARVASLTQRRIAAHKNWLPSLNFSGSIGTRSPSLSKLFDLSWLVWNVAEQITAPLFQGGRLKAERRIASAQLNEAINDYATIVLNAFREVETAMFSERALKAQLRLAVSAAKQLKLADELANEQYRNGLITVTSLLDTQRRALDARSTVIALKQQNIFNRITLRQALGGELTNLAP